MKNRTNISKTFVNLWSSIS